MLGGVPSFSSKKMADSKNSPPRKMLGGTGSDRFIGYGSATFTLEQLKAISDFNAAEDTYQL